MGKSKKAEYDFTPYNEYLDYLKNYDTSNVDNTLTNLTSWAESGSNNLANTMGNYTFNVNASDKARQQAQDATYQAYIDKLNPQFAQQTSDLSTALQNKGLAVGSEAYQRAMNDMQDNQNEARNQAAYQSVLAGQQAYSQDLANQINAGQFGNQAQQNYINQLLSALQGSASGYENQQNIFSVGSAKSGLKYEQDKANANGGLGGALSGALSGGVNAFIASGGNPYAAAAGAALGGYSGYNQNPYASQSKNKEK